MLDVIMCCVILHNILLGQSHEQVEQLLQILQQEGLCAEDGDEVAGPKELVEALPEHMTVAAAFYQTESPGPFLEHLMAVGLSRLGKVF